jgi:hypothetical protein
MVYDTPPRTRFKSFFGPRWLLSRTKACSAYSMTVVAPPGHSFDNALTPRASEKDRRETKETGKERGNGLTRFTALD